MDINELRQRIQLDSTTWQAVLQHAQDMRAEYAEAVMALANSRESDLVNKAKAVACSEWLAIDKRLRTPPDEG